MCKIYIVTVCLFVCVSAVTCDFDRGDGGPCEWEGVQGTCVSPRVCLTTLDKRGDKPPVCAQRGEETFICCTDCELVNDTRNAIISASGGLLWKNGRVSRDKCLDYLRDLPHKCYQEGYYGGISRQLDQNKKCHRFSIWGIGGAPPPGVVPSEFPFEAIIGYGENVESAVWWTTGAIISDQFILTSYKRPQQFQSSNGDLPMKFVTVGVNHLKVDRQKWQIHKVKTWYKYPSSTNSRDVYLLELETKITFNRDVLPACLPDQLIEIDTNKIKLSTGSTAIRLINDNTKDTPNIGTAGSTVVVNSYLSRCMNTIVGFMKNNFSGDISKEAYTKVDTYVPWIERIVWPVVQNV